MLKKWYNTDKLYFLFFFFPFSFFLFEAVSSIEAGRKQANEVGAWCRLGARYSPEVK